MILTLFGFNVLESGTAKGETVLLLDKGAGYFDRYVTARTDTEHEANGELRPGTEHGFCELSQAQQDFALRSLLSQ